MEVTIRIIIYSLVILNFVIQTVLNILDYRNRNAFIPEEVQDVYDAEKYKEWKSYYMENYIFGRVTSTINFVLFLLLLVFGGFTFIGTLTEDFGVSVEIESLLFLAIYFLIMQIVDLYPDYYDTFVIEEKYGFNKTTKRTFFLDKLKSIILTFVLGGSLLFGLQMLFKNTGNMFFVYAWISIMVIIFVTNIIYVPVIVPIFNKLTDLEDGELKDKINDFAKSVGYEVSKISVMDASRRSTKLNAYFTGFGRFKKIVLYDTLLEKMSDEQIIAVLAHEIGHNKHKHVVFNLIQTSIVMFLYVVVLGLVLQVSEFSTAFGFDDTHFGFSILLFVVLLQPVSMLLGFLTSFLSRRHEYQADYFAAYHHDPKHMEDALKVLGKENFANLTPHPLIVKMSYSHPPLVERIREIRKVVSKHDE